MNRKVLLKDNHIWEENVKFTDILVVFLLWNDSLKDEIIVLVFRVEAFAHGFYSIRMVQTIILKKHIKFCLFLIHNLPRFYPFPFSPMLQSLKLRFFLPLYSIFLILNIITSLGINPLFLNNFFACRSLLIQRL
mgnify:CR=1 FL=1